MLQQYFTPIEDKTIYKPYQIGACIQKYATHFPEIENKSIVLFSIQDKHGSADLIRKHLYQLATNTSFEKTVLDLGNIPSEKTPATAVAVQNILKEVFFIKNGNYNKENRYWKSFSILDEISKINIKNRGNLPKKIDKITKLYQNLSLEYQKSKISNNIPLK